MSANINDNYSLAQEKEDEGSKESSSPVEISDETDADASQPGESPSTSNQGQDKQDETMKDTPNQHENDSRCIVKPDETGDTLEGQQKNDPSVINETDHIKNELTKDDLTRRDNNGESESRASTTHNETKRGSGSSKRQETVGTRSYNPSLPYNLRLKSSASHNISVRLFALTIPFKFLRNVPIFLVPLSSVLNIICMFTVFIHLLYNKNMLMLRNLSLGGFLSVRSRG